MIGRALLTCLMFLQVAPSAAAGTSLPGGRGLVATASLSPSTHLFGDPIVARVDVVIDDEQFDPDRVDAQLRFAPYEPVGSIDETRREVDGLVHIRYEATLRCLRIACIAPTERSALGGQESRAERHTIRLPAAQIRYHEQGASAHVLLARRFPAVEVVSRINAARLGAVESSGPAGSEGVFVASLEPADKTYRVAPALLASLLFGGAFLLVLVPAAVVCRALLKRWRAMHHRGPLSPLQRALLLVDWTARQSDLEDRRKALEALAVVLEESDEVPLAGTVRQLAWAKEAPAGERAGKAGVEARSALAGGGAPHGS